MADTTRPLSEVLAIDLSILSPTAFGTRLVSLTLLSKHLYERHDLKHRDVSNEVDRMLAYAQSRPEAVGPSLI